MKCYVHPNEEAVAFCKSCGKCVCRECNVDVGRISYCRQCVNDQKAISQNDSKTFDNGLLFGVAAEIDREFNAGADGLLALGIISLFLVTFFEITTKFYKIEGAGIAFLFFIMILAMAISISITSMGYKALRTAYGNNIGIIARILSYISATFLLLFILFFIVSAFSVDQSSLNAFNNGLFTFFNMSFVFFGITQIIWGVAQITSREHTGKPNLAKASGIIMAISGAVTALALFYPYHETLTEGLFYFTEALVPGLIIFAVSAFLSSAFFMTAKKSQINH